MAEGGGAPEVRLPPAEGLSRDRPCRRGPHARRPGPAERPPVRRRLQPDGRGAHPHLRRDAGGELRPRRHDGVGDVPRLARSRPASASTPTWDFSAAPPRSSLSGSSTQRGAREPDRRRAPRDADPPDARRRAGPRERRARGLRARSPCACARRSPPSRSGSVPIFVDVARLRDVRRRHRAHARPVPVPHDGPISGGRMRAAADNSYGALVVGTDVRRVYAVAFGIGAACVGAAGALVSPILPFSPSGGLTASVAVVQHRHHRRDGEPARRLRGRAARLRRGVARRGVPRAVAQGARELLAAHRSSSCCGPPASSARAPREPGRDAARRARSPSPGSSCCPCSSARTRSPCSSSSSSTPTSGRRGTSSAATRGSSRRATPPSSAWARMLRRCCRCTPGSRRGSACSSAARCPRVSGVVIGYLGFRFGLRGFYFVLLTVAFAEICRIVALNTEALGGALGLYIIFTGNPRQFQFQDNRGYYYVALGLMLGATGIAAWIERHRFGAYLVRDPRRRGGRRGPRRRHVQVQDARDDHLVVPDGRRRDVLRVLPLLAPAQCGVRHPAVGRDHHPAHRGRGGHAARAHPRLVHPLAARRGVARLLPGGRVVRRAPHRLRRAPDRRRPVPAPGRLSVPRAPARASAGGERRAARGPGPVQALRRAPGRPRPVASTWRRARSLGLIGPNGAGKTTAVQPDLRLPRPRRGRRRLRRPEPRRAQAPRGLPARVWPARSRSCGHFPACPCSTTCRIGALGRHRRHGPPPASRRAP